MQYLTEAGFEFLEEALTRRQKLGIGLTAGLATLFGASRVGGKVSSPTPPRPNIVHQQSQRVGPEVLQRPKASEPSQERAAISSIADKEKRAKADGAKALLDSRKRQIERWRTEPPTYNRGRTRDRGNYSKKEVEHMLNVHPKHKDYGRKAVYDGDTFIQYLDR